MTIEVLPRLVFVIVMICWFLFAGVFLLWKKPASPPDQRREPDSLFGLALQGIAFGLVWGVRRPPLSHVVPGSMTLSIMAGVLAICAAIGSVWLIMMALKTLGKEWSLTARLVEGHKLAMSGPYAYVRHPIYSGMLGMLLATGLAVSRWPALVAALVVFFVGTTIRVRREEKLLREAFGEQFENYERKVWSIVPGLY